MVLTVSLWNEQQKVRNRRLSKLKKAKRRSGRLTEAKAYYRACKNTNKPKKVKPKSKKQKILAKLLEDW